MNLAMSAGFLTATVLLYSWAYGAYRTESSSIKNSAMGDTIAVTVCVTLTGLIALTLAFAIAAAIRFDETIADINLVSLAAIGICLALCWFAPRLILARMRTGGDNPTGSAPEGTVSSFPGSGGSKKPAAPPSGKHRKAA